MGDQNRESETEPADDLFDPVLVEAEAEDLMEFEQVGSEKQRLLAKRRRAERRLEELRLREELGDYDLHFDDF